MRRIRYHCDEVQHGKAGRMCKDAPPSYDVDTQRDYDEQVETCAYLAGSPEWYHASACKREAHMMVPGGRRQVRHPEEAYPQDPYQIRRGERSEGEPRSDASEERLASRSRPFDARTQSPLVRPYAGNPGEAYAEARGNPVSRRKKQTYIRQVKEALARYLAAQPPFLRSRFIVPKPSDSDFATVMAQLEVAGFPSELLPTLVGRLGGSKFTVSAVTPSLLSIVEVKLGGQFTYEGGSLYLRPKPRRRDLSKTPYNAELRALWEYSKLSRLNVAELAVWDDAATLQFSTFPAPDSETFSDVAERDEWQSLGSFPAWLFNSEIAENILWTSPDAGLRVTIETRVPQPRSVTLSLDFRPEEDPQLNYRRPIGLTLAELPALLVSLATRRKRRSSPFESRRRLFLLNPAEAPMARSNSMIDYLRARIPVARPNPLSEFRAKGQATYEQDLGPFGAGSEWTDGLQPMNRRNPKPEFMPKCNPKTSKRPLSSKSTAQLVKMAKGRGADAAQAVDELRTRGRDPVTGVKLKRR